MRLRETIKKAPVWVLDSKGEPVPGEVDLQEGWYALPGPGSTVRVPRASEPEKPAVKSGSSTAL